MSRDCDICGRNFEALEDSDTLCELCLICETARITMGGAATPRYHRNEQRQVSQMNQPLTMTAEDEQEWRKTYCAPLGTVRNWHGDRIIRELDAARAVLDASEQRFKARIEELEAQVADVPFVNHVNGSPVYQLLQKRLDAREQTMQQLQAVADKLAEELKSFIEYSTPLTALAGSQWADDHSSAEIDLCQVTHWLNVTSEESKAALAQYAEMKLTSSVGLPTDTGASQGGRE